MAWNRNLVVDGVAHAYTFGDDNRRPNCPPEAYNGLIDWIHGFLHLCGHDHETDRGEMMALQAQLERELLDEAPLAMSLKRGRKPGSKVKKLKDGSRVVVTGRAAAALVRRERVKKEKKVKVRKAVKPKEAPPKRGPGRPRKEAAPAPPKRVLRRSRPAPSRSGVIG